MAGNSIQSGNSAGTSTLAASKVQGRVMGGQQPVSGATIKLYAVGTSGYGAGSTSLLTSAVTTDANGNFSITGQYTCPANSPQVYIVATGGNPGLGGSVNNTGLAEMAALGTCPSGGTLAATVPFINISEVTTVAGVFALQQFMATPASGNKFAPAVGAPSTRYASSGSLSGIASAQIGLTNAFTTAKVLADVSTGQSPNTNYIYATPENAKINTIADILAYCVNSDPSTTTSCSDMFSAATPSGKTPAADTIQAAWYMAQNPINNLTNLYNFISATPPYQPILLAPMTLNTAGTGPATNAFNDTTIAINYAPPTASGSAVSAAYSVAIDAYGNAWLSNTGGLNGVASVTELGVDGSMIMAPTAAFTTYLTTGGASQFTTPPPAAHTFSAPKVVAVDLNNGAWIANEGETTSTGVSGGATVTAGDVANFTGSTGPGSNSLGGGTVGVGYITGYQPWGVAVDGSNNLFVTATATPSSSIFEGRTLDKIAVSNGTYTYSTQTTPATGTNSLPGGQAFVAVDANNANGPFVWVSNYNSCKVQGQFNAVTPFGVISLYNDGTDSAVSGSEIATAYSNATVGAGANPGTCNSTSIYVGQVMSAAMANPFGIAIDKNNGAWISDVFTSSLGFDGLTYISAPGNSNGTTSNSTFLVNGVLPTTTTAGTPGTTLTKAGAVAVDGNNNAWIANQTAKSVVEASTNGSTITLLTPGQGGAYGATGAQYGIGFVHNLATSTGIAIDPSGNVWVTNSSTSASTTYTNQFGTAVPTGNSVTVIVGAAGPVVTPLSLSIANTQLGQKP